MTLPARTATKSIRRGLRPAAMRSALTKMGQSASLGRNCAANVVFPAPFGPAIMSIFLSAVSFKVSLFLSSYVKKSELTKRISRIRRKGVISRIEVFPQNTRRHRGAFPARRKAPCRHRHVATRVPGPEGSIWVRRLNRRTVNRESSATRSGRIGECVVTMYWVRLRVS